VRTDGLDWAAWTSIPPGVRVRTGRVAEPAGPQPGGDWSPVDYITCGIKGLIKMGSEKWTFDNEAASWDKNPGRVKVANDIADAIAGAGILTSDMDVLEFGCGTGLLTLRLRPLVHSITGVDSSRGMVSVIRAKIESQSLTNIRTEYLDFEKGDVLEGSYDVVCCSMTLHHVKEIKLLLGQFYRVIAPDGYLCIADLDPDDGQFHGDNDTVFHHGFDRTTMRQEFAEAGFAAIQDRTAATVSKPIADGRMRSFGVFLMTGRKIGRPGQQQ
jgi:ubiquinone/menaquinone biosynthesis C-methylase UbiE